MLTKEPSEVIDVGQPEARTSPYSTGTWVSESEVDQDMQHHILGCEDFESNYLEPRGVIINVGSDHRSFLANSLVDPVL